MFRISALILALLCGTAQADNLTLMGVGAGNPATYTGPGNITSYAAWYGLRAFTAAIAAAATQKAVNVRNTGSGETCDILIATSGGLAGTVSNCSGASSGSSVATFCTGGCAVPKWYDQSGTGADMTQATAANQPTILFTGCSSGSLPCVKFVGSSSQQMDATISASASPHTYEAVAERNGATSSFGIIIGLNTSDRNHLYFNNAINSAAVAEFSGTVTATASDNAFHVLIGVGNGASTVLNVDNTQTTGSTTNVTSSTGAHLGVDAGVGLFLTALVSEVGYTTTAMSTGDQTSTCHNAYSYWTTSTSC